MWIGKKSLDAVLHFVSNLFIIRISGVLCSRFFPFLGNILVRMTNVQLLSDFHGVYLCSPFVEDSHSAHGHSCSLDSAWLSIRILLLETICRCSVYLYLTSVRYHNKICPFDSTYWRRLLRSGKESNTL